MFYTSYDNIGLVRVLSFLKSHREEYLSGQDLSDVLKISRVAVWKHIKTIKKLGYKIQTKQKLGYRLIADTKKLLPWEVVSGLQTRKIGKKIYYFDKIDSTQNFAQNQANSENGSVIIAEQQTHAKGRLQRKWESPAGGIWFSVVLRPKLDSSKISLVPIAVSVALCNAIKKTTKIDTKLKWPNDVTVDAKKIAGIIVDASIESNRLECAVIGIGINFDIDIEKTQKILKKTQNFYGIASIIQHDADADNLRLVQTFFVDLECIIEQLESGKTESVIKQWTQQSSTIGKKISTTLDGKKILGTAVKIDKDGALIIKTKDGNKKILAEDVSHVR